MTVQKLEREKKQQEEMTQKYLDDLKSEESRADSEQQLRKKLQDSLEVRLAGARSISAKMPSVCSRLKASLSASGTSKPTRSV